METIAQTKYTRAEVLAHRREWIAALRSGEFKQGQAALHSLTDEGERFCCLGVACKIGGATEFQRYVRKHTNSEGTEQVEMTYVLYGKVGSSSEVLPPAAMAWLGVTASNPSVNMPVGSDYWPSRSLATLNDEGQSFEFIADALERNGFTDEDDLLSDLNRGLASHRLRDEPRHW